MMFSLACFCTFIYLCHGNLEGYLDTNYSTIYYRIHISENLLPGSSVFNLGGEVTNFIIRSGNENGHFICDTHMQKISLSTFLNYDDRHEYILTLQWDSENITKYGVLTVIVENEADWPPVYNESCEFKDLQVRGEHDLPFPFRIRNSYKPRVAPDKPPNIVVHGQMDNSECRLTVVVNLLYNDLELDLFKQVLSDHKLQGGCKCGGDHFYIKPTIDNGSFSNDATNATSNGDVTIEYSSVENAFRIVFSHFTSDKVDKGMECYFTNIPDVIPKFHLTTVHAFYDIDVLGCPEGKFGGNCQYECYCQNGATCHIFNGACKCTTGWKGIACDIVTPSVVFTAPTFYSYVGRDLSFVCDFNHLNASDIYERSFHHNANILAKNTVTFNNDTRIYIWNEYERFGVEIYSVADQDAGIYECNVVDIYGEVYKDYTTLIVTGCENNRWGATCDKTCNCENNSNCSRKDGCICSQGWNGTYCTEDVGAPEFDFCPHNITALLDEGSSSTEVTWPKVEVNDNSGLFNLTSNHQARDKFIIGVHNILYTAVDNHGNTALCRFSVNVRAANIGTKKTVIVSSIVISLLLVVLVTFSFVVCLRYRKNRLMYPLIFGRSDDDDDKEWDAFVAVRGGTEDETFVYKELLYELEENNDYKVNIHHRDFIAGIPIVDNILYAIKNSRRTILILSPEFVRSEWCNYEVDQAKFEMFGLRHKLIPIMFEDVTHMGGGMSATLKSILDSINYLIWPRNGSENEKKEFWKRLIRAMPRNNQKQHLQQRLGFISSIVNRIFHRKLYLRLSNDNGCEEIDLEIM